MTAIHQCCQGPSRRQWLQSAACGFGGLALAGLLGERNAAAATHDWPTAWGENLILECFYEPVLNHGNRWLPERRSEVEQHVAPASRSSFVSDAAPYPIYTISRTTFWIVTALVVMAIVWSLGRRGAVAEASLV